LALTDVDAKGLTGVCHRLRKKRIKAWSKGVDVSDDPEAASIGLTEEEAKAKYGEIKVGKFPFVGCGRAVAASEQEGMVKIISDATYGEIFGVHILGPRATELIHLGAMAMKHEIGIEDIRAMVFAHPTFSEAFYEAALDTSDEAIHIIKEGFTSN
jgi:dihydrolipoamide dehydrogenase